MALRITWTEEAENTFEAIVLYLQNNWSEKEVQGFVKRVNKVLTLIRENPNLYRRSKQKGIHEAVVTKHNTLYYQVLEERIVLITFWDTRQDPDKLKL